MTEIERASPVYNPTSATFPAPERTPRWVWVALVLAMVWVALVRVPLVMNAPIHLDSDLAVDGLTLVEALQGHVRWHYPGTPHMGILPVLLSLPQAAIWGATPETLVSGGVVAYELVLLATFLLALRAFGPRVAAWSLVPLAFASTGTVWLAGRITGGHLLTVFWHAAAFAFLHANLTRGGILRAAGFGVWCGLGLYLDQMFTLSFLAILAVGIASWLTSGEAPRRWWLGMVFLLGVALGVVPRVVGVRADPYDAYRQQFETILQPDPQGGIDWDTARELAVEHTKILTLWCMPRLIAGHRLPALESDPHPVTFRGARPPRTVPSGRWFRC